jgi:uncharacterized protein (TIGR02996 family)
MTTYDELIQAILDAPHDQAPRLMLADLAAEQGDTAFEAALRHHEATDYVRLYTTFLGSSTWSLRDYMVWLHKIDRSVLEGIRHDNTIYAIVAKKSVSPGDLMWHTRETVLFPAIGVRLENGEWLPTRFIKDPLVP